LKSFKVWHGILMMLAWGVVLPIGMIVARFCRHRPNYIWFKVHMPFQICGALTAFTGGSLIFYTLWPNGHFAVWHAFSGIVLLCILFLQCCVGIFRPRTEEGKPKTRVRNCFKWWHAWTGRVILLAAFVQALSGILFINWPQWAFIVYFFWGVLILAVIIILEAWRCCRKTERSKAHYEYALM